MRTTVISGKGQVTIPAGLLRELELAAGTRLHVVPVRDGVMLLRRPESAADALAGSTAGIYGDGQEHTEAERGSWS